jgi:copper chaperone CopZ
MKGHAMSQVMTTKFRIGGMDCASCASKVEMP